MSQPPQPPPDRPSDRRGGGVDVLALEPVPTLVARVRAELSADFRPDRPTRVSRAPGRLDVMGGIADYTGSLVCEYPLDRAAAVCLQERDDRELQVFSFNLFDEHQPFTFRMSLGALARASAADLRREFAADPGRRWAGYLAGCLFLLHETGLVDLRDETVGGLNLALYSTVALGAGISSSAAIEVATMMNLVEHFDLRRRAGLDPLHMAALCQQVENRVVGAPCGIMDQATSCLGEAGSLMRLLCQPHVPMPPLQLPAGVRAVGINSNVKHSVGGGQYGVTRCAAFMGHRMILEKMRQLGQAAGREMTDDPMNGYLANLDPDHYKGIFRAVLPEFIPGSDFLRDYGSTIDPATTVQPDVVYPVQHAVDHHVLEARRVKHFVRFLEDAAAVPADDVMPRKALLDKAGHLMYASHLSYTNDAMLGAPECDLLVKLVRDNERHGLYGAKITGGGSGGTVAVLCNDDGRASDCLARIMAEYEQQTGKKPEAFLGTSPGAWQAGTVLI